ncbi:MAG: hypothetical protein H7328_05160 [Bdellovibrio sp.]|nr:hypothetical protein [Bdellovibrio sp.]
MFSNCLFIFVCMLVTNPLSWAQAPSMPAVTPQVSAEAEVGDIFLLCKRDKSVRWLRAYKLDSGKCKTLYSKEGYLQVVSSATYFASCEGVLQSVRQNIEEGGFKCTAMPQVSYFGIEN